MGQNVDNLIFFFVVVSFHRFLFFNWQNSASICLLLAHKQPLNFSFCPLRENVWGPLR